MSITAKIVFKVADEVSNMSSLTLVTFLITLMMILIKKHRDEQKRINRRLPPGPQGVPIFGMLPYIKKQFHLFLFDLSKTFTGGIFSFRLGGQLICVLTDPKIIKKAFAKSEFSARPNTAFSSILGGYGIINTDGQMWKKQRRFLYQHKFGLKQMEGNISNNMETIITRETFYLITAIESEKTNPFNPAPILNCAISNVICSIIMSTRFKHDDSKFMRFMHLFDEGFRLFQTTGSLAFFPIMRYIPGVANTIKEITACRNEMLDFVREIVNNHKDTLDKDQPRDLIDIYLLEIEAAKEADTLDTLFEGLDPEEQLNQILLDLFSAGVETLKNSLRWAILNMIHHPEVRKKVQTELNTVVGPHRLPVASDMTSLPYTQATIYEVMRRNTVIPLGTTHATDSTVELEGYIIPQNTHVIPSIHAVHMDPDVWEKPEEFIPERFLNDQGKVVRPPQFLPFSSGQRMCMGDKLAQMQLQLFFSTIMHVYDLEAPSSELPSMEGLAGVTVAPKDFEVNFIPRNVEALITAHSKTSSSQFNQTYRMYG